MADPTNPKVEKGDKQQLSLSAKPSSTAGSLAVHDEPPRSSLADRQEFFLPVSGFIWLYPEEVTVVNHPTFQRLGRIYQLGQTYLVYRGATHKRIEHSLGALHVAHRIIEAIERTSEKKPKHGQPPPGAALSESERRFVRLGALLHDIGHLSAGHTVEDELLLVGQHDCEPRLDRIFDELRDDANESLSEVVDRLYGAHLTASLRTKVTPSVLLRLLIRKSLVGRLGEGTGTPTKDPYSEAQTAVAASNDFRLDVCRDIIGDTICADLLDYLYRDWYHVGKPRPVDERILQYMEIRTPTPPIANAKPLPNAGDRFVISLGSRPKIRTDAVSAILDLLEWRYQLAESVLFHRTKLAAAAMLDRALFELLRDDSGHIEDMLLPLSDEEMIEHCLDLAKGKSKNNPGAAVALRLLGALRDRRLYSPIFTRFYDDLPPDVRSRLQTHFSKAPDSRRNVLRVLERDFDLSPGSLVMYCPSGQMNAKIAAVKIAVGHEVEQFNRYEEKHSNQLSGGHLGAQLNRFQRLWRVQFFIDDKAMMGLEKTGASPMLALAIEKLALSHLTDGITPLQASRMLATALSAVPSPPWQGKIVTSEAVAGAWSDAGAPTPMYPFGSPAISAFLADAPREVATSGDSDGQRPRKV